MTSAKLLGWLAAMVTLAGCAGDATDETAEGPPPTGLAAYPYRRSLVVEGPLPQAYSLSLTFDHANLVAEGLALEDGADLRVGYELDGALVELDRVLDPASSWNAKTTTIWFRSPEKDLTGASFGVWFGKLKPEPVRDDPREIYDVWVDFDSDAFDEPGWTLAKLGMADGSFEPKAGQLRLRGQSGDFGGTSDQGVFFHRSAFGDFAADTAISGFGGSLGGLSKMGGLMVRSSVDADASFAMGSVQSLPRKQVALARATKGEKTLEGTELPATDALPQRLQLVRSGSTVTASYSDDGRTWVAIGPSATLSDLQDSVLLGVPFANVSSDYGYVDVDWVRVVKRVTPAPTATLGPEN